MGIKITNDKMHSVRPGNNPLFHYFNFPLIVRAALTQFDKSSYLNHNSSDYYSHFNLRYSQIIISLMETNAKYLKLAGS